MVASQRRVRIRTLEQLDGLDGLISDYRNKVARHDVIPRVPIGRHRA